MRLRRYRNGCFPYGGFGLRCRLQLFGSAMPVAVGRGCHAVLFAEEFDEGRGVGKGACGADFGDRLVGRDQKQPGMDQALPDEPLVGRGPVDAEKFLFERSQGAVAAFCDLLDRNIGKDVGIDDLLEVVPGRIDVAQQLAFDATIPVRNDQVEQFGHFEVFGGRVVQERSFREAIVDVAEKTPDRTPARHRGVVQGTAVVALVVVGDIQLVGDVEVQQDALQLFRGIANEDLCVGMSLRGDVFGIVATHTEEEKISLGELVAFIVVIDVFFSVEDISDHAAGELMGFDAVVGGRYILFDRRINGLGVVGFVHNRKILWLDEGRCP